MDLKEEGLLKESVDSHWYYHSKARAVERMLPGQFNKRIMDIGAGSGFLPRYLAKKGIVDHAICIDPNYTHEKIEKIGSATLEYVKDPIRSDCDVALFLDVLEHVEDDIGLLKSYRKFLPERARAIITVPAFQFLWSGHDIFLEHYRRYTIGSLGRTLEQAGYQPLRMHYYYALVFPAAVVNRMVSRKKMEPRSKLIKHDKVTNFILKMTCSAERPWMAWNRLFGLSVCAICEIK